MKIGYIPTNEQGVIYYFSKYHKNIGFEKIIKMTTRFPDVTALRLGEKVKIELEYKLSSFSNHYKYIDRGYWANEFRWRESKNKWWLYNRENKEWVDYCRYDVRERDSFEPGPSGGLHWKTLSDQCDCIICWVENTVIDDDIEVINLKEEIEKLC